MKGQKVNTQELGKFGRTLSLLFNRVTMYKVDHPYVKQSFDDFYLVVEKMVKSISPLVFILNREQFFIDEEPLDPRINTNRILSHFKNAGIQSISFENGLNKNELKSFLEIFVSLNKYPDAEAMKAALSNKGINHLRINHVFYKKVTEDDEVIAREALDKITPQMGEEAQQRSKKMFLDMILESVLGEEMEKTLTLQNLVRNPTDFSKNMIEADISSYQDSGAEDRSPGPVLLHQLQMIGQEVEKSLSSEEDADISVLAAAVFDMKKQIMDGIESQKSLDINYSNEEEILSKANEITDNVLIKLIKKEYKAGKISTPRLAQILRRLVPEANELKRLLPKIRIALLEEGMPMPEFLKLIQELGRELQSDELAKILEESAEEVGLDGKDLIEEIKKNPVHAAEMIYLAAEIKKGTGDEKVLGDLMVDYVEQLGSTLTEDLKNDGGPEGEQHLRQVMSGLESGLVGRLRGMDIKTDVLEQLEEKINSRMDGILDKFRTDWLESQSGTNKNDNPQYISILQMLEQSVSEDEDLGQILREIRVKAGSNEIDEDDFKQIYEEINRQQEKRLEQEAKREMPQGILKSDELTFYIEKELQRAKRYELPFSALSFSVVKAKPKRKPASGKITRHKLHETIFRRLSSSLRSPDILGMLGKNAMVALLPMTFQREAKSALRRSLKDLHSEPIDVTGIPVAVRLAGVATGYEADRMPDSDAFIRAMTNELSDMIVRVKNIQDLF